MNRIAETITGWRLSEVLGKRVDHVMNLRDDRGGLANPLGQAMREKRIVHLATSKLIRRDRSTTMIADSASPITVDGDVEGGIMVFRYDNPPKAQDK